MDDAGTSPLRGYWLTVAFLALLPLPFVGLADQVASLDAERPAQALAAFAAGNAAAFLSERFGGHPTSSRLGMGAFLVVSMVTLALALTAMPFVNATLSQAGLVDVAGSRWVALALGWWESVIGCLLLAGLMASAEPRARARGASRLQAGPARLIARSSLA